MSLSSSMANALSGLKVNNRLIETTSTNLANALTDGYARRTVNVTAATIEGKGVGVSVRSVTRESAPELTATRRIADAEAAESTIVADALKRIGRDLGEATAEDGLFRRVEDFERALRQLSETPESRPRQLEAAETARDVASQLNNLSEQLRLVRQDADAAIARDVQTVNRNLEEIRDLNARIRRLSFGDAQIPGLIDERARMIDEVNAIIPIQIQEQPNNVLHIHTVQGQFLVQETVEPLEFTPTQIITAAMVYDPAGSGALSGLSVWGQDITPGSITARPIETGSLAGYFQVRDQIAPLAQERLDRFAADLIARFEDPALDATLAPGDPGLYTDNGGVLDLTVIEGLAGRISLNSLVDPSQGGDAARLRDGLQAGAPGPITSDVQLRAYLDRLTAEQPAAAIPGLSGTRSVIGNASGIVELNAIARTTAETDASRLSATRAELAESEASEIGVDQDVELQNLIKIEQAYAANVQVIQSVSQMLRELLEIR